MNRVFSRMRTVVTVQATLAVVLVASVAGADEFPSEVPGAEFEPSAASLEAAITSQGFEPDVEAQALALLDDAASATSDVGELASVSTELAHVLVEPDQASPDWLAGFFNDYEVVFAPQGAADWDIDPNPLKKCDRRFNCVWRSWICVRITWSEPGGGGGVNCISK